MSDYKQMKKECLIIAHDVEHVIALIRDSSSVEAWKAILLSPEWREAAISADLLRKMGESNGFFFKPENFEIAQTLIENAKKSIKELYMAGATLVRQTPHTAYNSEESFEAMQRVQKFVAATARDTPSADQTH